MNICIHSSEPNTCNIQLFAVIMWSNITYYCIRHCWDTCISNIRFCTYNRHPTPSFGVSIVRIFNKIDRIIWANVDWLLIGLLGSSFNKIWITIKQFWYTKTNLKMSSAKWGPFCLGINMFNPSLPPGDRLKIKMFYQYRDPYVKDKTVSQQSYL